TSIQTSNLLAALDQVTRSQDRLVVLWGSNQSHRPVLYRDLGTMPYEDWKSFLGQFSTGDGGGEPRPVTREDIFKMLKDLPPAPAAAAPATPHTRGEIDGPLPAWSSATPVRLHAGAGSDLSQWTVCRPGCGR